MGALMRAYRKQDGFSLVEILVVLVIMGLVMTSVYGIYLSSQKTSITSEEVVDVQQNLRIAYDMMARDLRMAGFSISESVVAAEGDSIAVRMASPFLRYARILQVENSTGTVVGQIDSNDNDVFSFFIPGEHARTLRQGNVFRICRPQDGRYVPDADAADTYFVAEGDPKQAAGEWYIELSLVAPDTTSGAIDFEVEPNGDLLARVFDGYYPYDNGHVVIYELVDDTSSDDPNMFRLMRKVCSADGVTEIFDNQVLASKIHDDPAVANDGLRFGYVMADGTFVDTQVGESVADYGYAPSDVIAVQVQLTGSTDATRTGAEQYSGVKTREVLGRVHIKNRKVSSGT